MDSIKIAHIADAHLGCAFSDLDEKKRVIRRQEILSSFEKAIKLSLEKGAEIILIAGDIFDNDFIGKETITFVKNVLNSVSIPVFIAPGNHDPYTTSIYDTLKDGLNQNITIFENKITKVSLGNINIYGYGFDKPELTVSVLEDFCAEDDGINIMVLHAGGIYNPVSDEQIKNSGLSYLALGHTHEFSGVKKLGSTHYAYCGTHDGHGFDELGVKGILIGSVSKSKAEMEFYPTSSRLYKTIGIDISSCETTNDIIALIKSNISGKENLYKFVLTGMLSQNITIDTDVLSSMIDGEAFYAEVKDKTTPSFDLDEISKDYSLKGIVAKNLIKEFENAKTDEEREILNAVSSLLITSIEKGGNE